jgi:ubiquitin-protein ligase
MQQEVAKQVRSLQKARLHGVQQVEFDVDDPMTVNIALLGASGTPFEGRQLFLALDFPADYPYKPPAITFQHPLYHPNVYKDSYKLCWTDYDTTGSSYNLEGIIGMVNTLMAKPNTESPANRDAADLYMEDEKAWHKAARAKAQDVLFTV